MAGKSPLMRVANAANELGFNHPGRFSRQPFQFSGEYLSERLEHDRTRRSRVNVKSDLMLETYAPCQF
jgi:hypothetical protein